MIPVHDILRQLDDAASAGTFPTFNNGHVYPADQRMTVYSNARHWAVFIEILGYDPRGGALDGIQCAVYPFGNCLRHRAGPDSHIHIVNPVSTVSGEWEFDGSLPERISSDVKEVKIHNQVVDVSCDQDQYTSYGIELHEPPTVYLYEWLRMLAARYDQMLLCNQDDLAEFLACELPVVLEVRDWYHPDVFAGELPSKTRCFQMIAEVAASADSGRYVPSERPNTNWRNWPLAGTL